MNHEYRWAALAPRIDEPSPYNQCLGVGEKVSTAAPLLSSSRAGAIASQGRSALCIFLGCLWLFAAASLASAQSHAAKVLENRLLSITIDPETGHARFVDKQSKVALESSDLG